VRNFSDQHGRTWAVEITPRTLRQVREAAGFDLLDPASDPVDRLVKDAVLLADVLWVLSCSQAQTAGISQGDFLDGLDLPALVRGRGAVCQCISDFLKVGELPANISAANAAGLFVNLMLMDYLALGNGSLLGIPEVPPPDGLRARLLDLAATLRAAEVWQAEALFQDLEAAERQILAHRQAWRRRQWYQANPAGVDVGP